MANDPPFELAPGEAVIASSRGATIQSALSLAPGRLWLTNQRLAFTATYGWLFGIIGMLFAKKDGVSLPLDAIATYERTSFGRNKNVLRVAARDGVEHKFVVDDFDAFTAALASQRTA